MKEKRAANRRCVTVVTVTVFTEVTGRSAVKPEQKKEFIEHSHGRETNF